MIDPEFLDQLDQFDTTLKRDTSSMLQGEQESRSVGEGLTFSDYRQYSPGDDTRLIDWKLYARTDEYFVKQFEEERNLTLHVLLDASASMEYGEGETNKFEYGAKIGLGFAYLFAEEHNPFRFSVFRTTTDRLDGGRSNRGELMQLIELLNGVTPQGEAEFSRALSDYAATINSRSLVLVVSDFLTDPDEFESGLVALSENDVVLAQVLSPEELAPTPSGDTIFEEPEQGSTLRTYFGGRSVGRYQDRLQGHLQEVEARSHRLRGEYSLIDTGADFFESFSRVWVG